MRSILLASTAALALSFGAAQAQTTWSVTPSSGYGLGYLGTASGALTFTVGPITPDGSIMMAGTAGSLMTMTGIWTFGSKTGPGGNQILLNGSPAGTGYGVELKVSNGGNMYAQNASGN